MSASRREFGDLLRSGGGVLLAAGAVALLARKPGGHEWSHLGRLLIVFSPAAALYIMAITDVQGGERDTDEPWRSVLLVTAVLLGLTAMFVLLAWIGVGSQSFPRAGAFAAAGLLAGYGAHRAHVPFGALLAALASLVAWLTIWSKVLHPSADTLRILLIAGGALLLLGSVALRRAEAIGAGELATVGGGAVVAAGVLGVVIGFFAVAFNGLVSITGSAGVVSSSSSSGTSTRSLLIPRSAHGRDSEGLPHLTNGIQHFGWDLYLLVVSVVLLWVGSRSRNRGLGYVGGIGILAFLLSVGTQLTRTENGQSPSTTIVGWPLALVVVGAGALIGSARYTHRSRSA
ncbi:MAG TPA: hypothetical protein VGN25_05425 [Solirubrobacteraceae bacterium]|nr:hypothetical protein [Solirubrobacteraceae bacterium]